MHSPFCIAICVIPGISFRQSFPDVIRNSLCCHCIADQCQSSNLPPASFVADRPGTTRTAEKLSRDLLPSYSLRHTALLLISGLDIRFFESSSSFTSLPTSPCLRLSHSRRATSVEHARFAVTEGSLSAPTVPKVQCNVTFTTVIGGSTLQSSWCKTSHICPIDLRALMLLLLS